MPPNVQCIFAFGEFTFEYETGDLIRNGRKSRLPEQTARLLTRLLERAGTMVTREELQLLLWPEGEFLDRDQGINNAISKLRLVLRDDPVSPQFIETIPKRGYRFLAGVETVSASHRKSVADTLADGRTDLPPIVASPLDRETAEAADPPGMADAIDRTSSIPVALTAQDGQPRSSFITKRSGMIFAGIAFAILAVTFLAIRHSRNSQSPESVNLGIVPFEVEGEGAKQLAESFRLDLMDAMAELPAVQVHAAHSLNNVKKDEASIRALSRTVQLDVLLFGKFKLQGNEFAFQLELVRGRDAIHIASHQYRGTRAELASVREKVQRDIYTELRLAGGPVQHLRGSTANPQAYEAYLRARHFLSLRSEESTSRALEEFRAAIADDPKFAKAYAGMATAHLIRADYLFAPVLESVAKAEELARQSLQINPAIGEAHAVLGYASFRHDWNATLGEKELRQAIELDPNQALYHVWFAVLLSDESRFDESFQQIDLAHASDPLWAPIYGAETFLAANARQSAREMGAAQKLNELLPNWPAAHDEMAWSLWHAKRYADAIGEWKRMALLESDQKRADLEERGLRAFRSGGVPAYARVRLSWIKTGIAPDRHANDFVPAEWYAYAEDKDNAIRALEDMMAHHDPDALQMAVTPAYRDLHRDPRFRALLTRLNLPLPIASPKDALRSSLK